MKKKIVAILATIAAVFGFGFAANTAMAYGATGEVSGNVATFTFTGLTPGQRYVVSYDDTTVENVTLTATKYSNVKEAHKDGTLTATYTLKSGFAGTIASSIYAVDGAGNPTGAALATASVPPAKAPPRRTRPLPPVLLSLRTLWPSCCWLPPASPWLPFARALLAEQ